MVSTVKSRPNHYEMLGLAPAASSDEIARAFTREIAKPRAFGGIAHISIAYETLRDPAKRRAYDEIARSRAEARARARAAPSRGLPVAAGGDAGQRAAVDGAARGAANGVVHRRVAKSAGRARAAPRDGCANPAASGAAAGAFRPSKRIGNSSPSPRRRSAALNPRARRSKPTSARSTGSGPRSPPARSSRRSGCSVHGAGREAGNDIDPEQPPTERAVTAALPPAKPVAPPSAVPASEPAPILAEARRDRPRRGTIAEARPTPTPAPSIAPEERLADIAEGLQGPPQEIASEPAVAEAAPAVAAVAASMPLPNSVIARTIGRIGIPRKVLVDRRHRGRLARRLQGDLLVRPFLPRRAGPRRITSSVWAVSRPRAGSPRWSRPLSFVL